MQNCRCESGGRFFDFTAADLDGNTKFTCDLTHTAPAFGSVQVDSSLNVSHTRSEADANDTLILENGMLSVTTEENEYELQNGCLIASNDILNGTVTATSWVYSSEPEKIVEFKYDHNGLRTQKKVTQNGVTTTTNYTLHGKMVTHMTVGSDKLHFFYDAQSRPAKVNHNGTIYTYLHNLQGDIVGIVDNGGNLVVEYKYDAWGKLLATTGTKSTTLGKLNPFRYRGYIYDEETGFYYLQSRYYTAYNCRFVNADNILGSGIAIFTHDAFTYCHNNSIIYCDPTGHSIESDTANPLGGSGWTSIPHEVVIPVVVTMGWSFLSIYKQIDKLKANDRTYSKTNTKDTPKEYQLAIAFGTGEVKPFGPKISYGDAKIAIENSLINKNDLAREYRDITGDKAPSGHVRAGIYAENKVAAEILASTVAPKAYYHHDGHLLGDSGNVGFPHFHLGNTFKENIHIWYPN